MPQRRTTAIITLAFRRTVEPPDDDALDGLFWPDLRVVANLPGGKIGKSKGQRNW